MSDSYTEVSSQSWFSRIGQSIKGIFFGLILFVVAFPVLFWNEGRAINTQKSLEEGAAAVVSIEAQPVHTQNEGKLVHLSGQANTTDTLEDTQFNIKTQAIKLSREVKIFQWQEHTESKTEKEMGGSTKTTKTYTYSKGWSSYLKSSSSFKHPQGHENPTHIPFQESNWHAKSVSVGDFALNHALIKEINGSNQVKLSNDNLPSGSKATLIDGEIYIGDPNEPQVGDLRITFHEVKPQPVSIIAAQSGHSFTNYMTSTGKAIQLLNVGKVTARQMFDSELDKNTLLTWGLRVLGFFIMFIGLTLILKPLSVLGDVVPFIGNLIEGGAGLVSGIISFILTLITVAIAWVVYRPIVAVVLIGVVLGTFYLLKKKVKTNKAMGSSARPASPPPPPPPPA
ncbi:MAG: hypothetical protein GY694_05160 [Gammaproteobacteria bacterium]|nr:hypothetical protein [Gammaproteobacteria bacterium]